MTRRILSLLVTSATKPGQWNSQDVLKGGKMVDRYRHGFDSAKQQCENWLRYALEATEDEYRHAQDEGKPKRVLDFLEGRIDGLKALKGQISE